jgi:hypothetical protein
LEILDGFMTKNATEKPVANISVHNRLIQAILIFKYVYQNYWF